MNKTQWVEVFEAAGLSERMMADWHQQFEHRYPEGHQSFLQWLGLTEDEISEIRQRFG